MYAGTINLKHKTNPNPHLKREIRAENQINIFRGVFVLTGLISILFYNFFVETPTVVLDENLPLIGYFLALIPTIVFIHKFTKRTFYSYWIKYLTATIDFSIVMVLALVVLTNKEQLWALSQVEFLLSISFLLIFVNTLSVIRISKMLVYYSGALAVFLNVLLYAISPGNLLFGLYTSTFILLLSLINIWATKYLLDYWNVNNELTKAYNELQAASESISLKNEEISTQSEQIIKHIESLESIQKDHTDSLIYAQKIQKALINNEEILKNYFKDYFIFLKPKSLVTGDFYWISKAQDKIIIAVSDCTGHGVPGAFMTMLGYSYLNEIVNKEHITEPDKILNELRENIISTLHQDGKIYEQKDGMDMAVIQIDKKAKKLKFSAANNSLCYIPTRASDEDKKVYEFKGDRMPISFHYKMRHFSLLELDIREGDRFYLYTDGYIDQFGGPKGKKFKSVPFRKILLKNNNLPMLEQKNILKNTMEDWLRDTYEQVDDITVVGFEI